MTMAASFERGNHHLAIRARWNWRLEGDSLKNLVFSIVLALPFALLWDSGAAFAVGIAWAVAYVVLAAVPTAIYVLMMFDAGRVLAGKTAGFMPVFIAMGRRGRKVGVASRHPVLAALAGLGVAGNPLSSVTRELWILAFRFNPDALDEMNAVSRRMEVELDRTGVAQQLIAAELKEVPRHRATLELVTC